MLLNIFCVRLSLVQSRNEAERVIARSMPCCNVAQSWQSYSAYLPWAKETGAPECLEGPDRSKELMPVIWTAAHSGEALAHLPFSWAMRSNGYEGLN
jgi:hypothetical protein